MTLKPGFLCRHQDEGLRRNNRVSVSPHCAVCQPPRETLLCPPRASPAHSGGQGGWSAWPATPSGRGLRATGWEPACGALGQPVCTADTPHLWAHKACQHQSRGGQLCPLPASRVQSPRSPPQAEDGAGRVRRAWEQNSATEGTRQWGFPPAKHRHPAPMSSCESGTAPRGNERLRRGRGGVTGGGRMTQRLRGRVALCSKHRFP